ncbi:MAG: OsmC family protein [Chloroflexi bacterium]|nr:OsmC family protein [Chloroflexota bacterium]
MAASTTRAIRATWIESRQFTAYAEGSGGTVPIDARHGEDDPPARGTSPMELLLMGVAGCTGMDVISVLQKKREHVTAYYVTITGERAEGYPSYYTRIYIDHEVHGKGISAQSVERAIWLSTTKYCSAINSLKAEVETSYRIIEVVDDDAEDGAS